MIMKETSLKWTAILALLFSTALPMNASAASQSEMIENHQTALENLISGIDEQYPIQEIADRLVESLEEALNDQQFVGQTEASFVEAINTILWEQSNDLHLRLYDEEGMAARYAQSGDSSAPRVRRMMRRPGGGGNGPQRPIGTSRVESEMLTENTGIISFKSPIYNNPEIFTSALQAVEAAQNIIIDLRDVPGGTGTAVQYFLSQFYGTKTLLGAHISRRFPEPVEIWSVETDVGQNFASKNLYVLINDKTASGAEAMSFTFMNTGRAILIGEKTAGAGNAGTMISVGEGLQVFLPMSRAINPQTGEYFEGIGIVPNVETPSSNALSKALELINS